MEEVVEKLLKLLKNFIKTFNAITIISKWCNSVTYDRQINPVDEKEPKYVYDKLVRIFRHTVTLDKFASEMHEVFQEITETPFEEN